MSDNELRGRVEVLEMRVEDLRGRAVAHETRELAMREDNAATRTLAGVADRDVADFMIKVKAQTRLINALRETQLEEREARIALSHAMVALTAGQVQLKTDVQTLQEGQQALTADVSGLKTDVTQLKTDVSGLKTDVRGLRDGQSQMQRDVAEILRRLDSGAA